MIRRPPRSTLSSSSAASDVYKRQVRQSPVRLVPSVLPSPSPTKVSRTRHSPRYLQLCLTPLSCSATLINEVTGFGTSIDTSCNAGDLCNIVARALLSVANRLRSLCGTS
eukprot:TRINITY_DN27016_c0_g1_i1.p1 TRINITY_DN27016_c0_g1~~TRINITY_DN27016_c0_g1_i1.p1  ORF type:complete len:110 (+),score=11.66 TRINITY_DN27016_c0_g1_i1:140-469(+)